MRNENIKRKLNNLRKKICFLCTLLICLLMITGRAEAAKRNTWMSSSDNTYYYNKKGKKVTGLKKIKGQYYYFDKKGVLYKKGWKTLKGKKYYFAKKSGAASTGVVKIGKKKYLFSNKGKLYGTGLQNYRKKHYYTKKGVLQTGLKTVKSKTYYFTSGGQAKTGWVVYKGKRYYFGANGAAVTGKQRIAGKTYQFSSKGVLQKEQPPTPAVPVQKPDQKPDPEPEEPETEAKRPVRPVEPTVQDPDVIVPVVNPVENTKENMEAGENALVQAFMRVSDVEGVDPAESYPIPAKDCEPNGYQIFMEVVEEARAMKEATNLVLEADRKWILVFDPAKGTFVKQQRAFDPDNYPYTATELFQEAEKLKAYREQRIVIQAEQVLTYYQEQSKAIFDKINEYRISKGVAPLAWSINLLKTARIECGYRSYVYEGSNEGSDDYNNFVGHSMSQLSVSKCAGVMNVDEIMKAWLNSSWHEPWLWDATDLYGAVAFYTYNSATTGVTWSKVIFQSWSRDEMPTFSNGNLTVTAPEEAWPTILNCETSSEIIP